MWTNLANFSRWITRTRATNRAAGNHTGGGQHCQLTSGGTIRKAVTFASFRIVRCDSSAISPCTTTRGLIPEWKHMSAIYVKNASVDQTLWTGIRNFTLQRQAPYRRETSESFDNNKWGIGMLQIIMFQFKWSMFLMTSDFFTSFSPLVFLLTYLLTYLLYLLYLRTCLLYLLTLLTLLTYLLTYLTYLLTGLNPSCGAIIWSATQELPSISWNPKVQYRIHKGPPLFPILSPINSIHAIPSYLSKIHFDIVHPPMSWSSQWSLSVWLPHQYSIRIPVLTVNNLIRCESFIRMFANIK
jgi:hypothetical protein